MVSQDIFKTLNNNRKDDKEALGFRAERTFTLPDWAAAVEFTFSALPLIFPRVTVRRVFC